MSVEIFHNQNHKNHFFDSFCDVSRSENEKRDDMKSYEVNTCELPIQAAHQQKCQEENKATGGPPIK
tara:strand:+ start:322 stop:522 length:201 start_codon:yes stop_codon:yes gene_type:complete